VPRATTRRQDAPLVQFGGDCAHAGDPLGAQVIHEGPQVGSTLLRVRLDSSHGLLVADVRAPERPGARKATMACCIALLVRVVPFLQ
jgi:hypothetical protein